MEVNVIVNLEYGGTLDVDELTSYLKGALDAFVGDNPKVEYIDHDIYEELPEV